MDNVENLSLRGVFEEYPVALFDTCSLKRALDFSGESDVEQERRSAEFFYDEISDGRQICVIPAVLGEYTPNRSMEGYSNIDAQIRLAKLIGQKNRVLKTNLEEFRSFRKKYSPLLSREVSFTRTDLDLLASGLAFSKASGPICIVSNDFPLLVGWKKAVNEEGISRFRLGFFLRRGFDEYETGRTYQEERNRRKNSFLRGR